MSTTNFKIDRRLLDWFEFLEEEEEKNMDTIIENCNFCYRAMTSIKKETN